LQEDQLVDLKSILNKEKVEVSQLSPMIRARLLAVNGEAFDKGTGRTRKLTREEEREMRFRNRGFNLSYRSNLIDSESMVAGTRFSGTYEEGQTTLPEISLEKRFAERLKLKIGDTMTFDIQDVEITGKVVNLRSVKWTSFQPNFFIQFQPGVLDMAPKTFLATLPAMNLNLRNKLQTKLVEKIPNASIIDVSRLIKKILSIVTQMSWALRLMATLCLIAGFVVIYSISNHQAKQRSWDIGLLKSLGATFSTIRGQFLWQFGLISLFAGFFGASISLAVSFVFSTLLFEEIWAFDLLTPLASVILCVVITVFVTHLSTRKALEVKVSTLLSVKG
jgi:putative ABC transport system permease protein